MSAGILDATEEQERRYFTGRDVAFATNSVGGTGVRMRGGLMVLAHT
jgi:hypothetical protein